MVKFGYTLSSEEIHPENLIGNAAFAESFGFDFLSISDHISPWINNQGHSSFVWTVLGGIAQVTSNIEIIVGVNCPIIRYSPIIVAQASATCAMLMENRFWLGVGTGENLNEHVAGAGWPHIDTRQEMLIEAINIIKKLWTGEYVDYRGKYYTTERAKIYSLPKKIPKLVVSAFGEESAKIAAEYGDAYITTDPSSEIMDIFNKNGGDKKPKMIQISVCYAPSEEAAHDIVRKYWPIGALNTNLMAEIRLPEYFEEALSNIPLEDAIKSIACGPDPKVHLKNIQKCIEAGFDYIYIHQIGLKQKDAIQFYSNEIIPRIKALK